MATTEIPSFNLVPVLDEAAKQLIKSDVSPYVRLRQFVLGGMSGDAEKFKLLYSNYYGLRFAGLTPQFKETYFRILFAHRPHTEDDPYTPILRRLYDIQTFRGTRIVAASFVSKLVAIHDDARPLYDSRVGAFFGIGVPAIKSPAIKSPEFRIAGFVQNLCVIRSRYEVWQKSPEIVEIIEMVRHKMPQLADTHPNRICDFLVCHAAPKKVGQ